MRNAFVGSQFHHLWVDQDQPHLVRSGPGQSDTSIELTKLDLPEPVAPATSRCGILARFAETKSPSMSLPRPITSRVMVTAGRRGGENVCQTDHFAIRVGHLDAHRRLSGDRASNARCPLPPRRRYCVAASDFLDLYAGTEFHFVACDCRSPGEAGDRCVDFELIEHGRDRIDNQVVGGTAPLGRIAGGQQVQRGQRVGALHDTVQWRRAGLEIGLLGFKLLGFELLG